MSFFQVSLDEILDLVPLGISGAATHSIGQKLFGEAGSEVIDVLDYIVPQVINVLEHVSAGELPFRIDWRTVLLHGLAFFILRPDRVMGPPTSNRNEILEDESERINRCR